MNISTIADKDDDFAEENHCYLTYEDVNAVSKFLDKFYFKYYVVNYTKTSFYPCENGDKSKGCGLGVCRCEKITNVNIISINYNPIIDNFLYLNQNAQDKIHEIFKANGFTDIQNWYPIIKDDYYGDIISNFALNDTIKNNIIHDLNIFIYPNYYHQFDDDLIDECDEI